MSWLRLDDGFASHPKIAALSDREFRIWMRTLCYCARAKDPTVDRITYAEVPGLTPRLTSKLHQLSLVDRVGNAHEIHDWVKYQPSDETGAERQARYRARRLKQAKPPRDTPVTDVTVENELSTVTPTVTPPVTKSSPSRARAARPVSTNPVPVPVPEANYDGTGTGTGTGELEQIDPLAILEQIRGQP